MGKPNINYIGYPGHGNLGDDALFQANQKIFREYQLIPDNQIQYSKITLFGGGTVLPHFSYIVVPNQYNYAYGVGVRNPRFWKHFQPNFHPSLMINRVKKFNFRLLGVRDKASENMLKSWGMNSTVIGDPCLILEPTSYNNKLDRSKIAVNVGSDGIGWGKSDERVDVEVAKLITMLKEEGYYPILVPFWFKNLSRIEKIAQITNVPVFKEWKNTQSVLNFISSCYVTIGEKLHSIIFSSAAHVPFISLEYRPKCYYFAELMGFQDYCVRTDTLNHNELMMIFRNLSDNWDERRGQLIEKVRKCRKDLRDFAQEIKKDIEHLPEKKWSVTSSQRIECLVHQYALKSYLFIQENEKRKQRKHMQNLRN